MPLTRRDLCARLAPLLSAAAMPTPAPAQTTARTAAPSEPSLRALAADWAKLRRQRGHFDGAAWNPAVDAYGGRKHQLMQKMAEQLLLQHATKAQLLQTLGKPDETVAAKARSYGELQTQSRWQGESGGEYLIYTWRTRHDKLVIALREGRVVGTGWWHALE